MAVLNLILIFDFYAPLSFYEVSMEVVCKVRILAHFGIWLNFTHFQNRQK